MINAKRETKKNKNHEIQSDLHIHFLSENNIGIINSKKKKKSADPYNYKSKNYTYLLFF